MGVKTKAVKTKFIKAQVPLGACHQPLLQTSCSGSFFLAALGLTCPSSTLRTLGRMHSFMQSSTSAGYLCIANEGTHNAQASTSRQFLYLSRPSFWVQELLGLISSGF